MPNGTCDIDDSIIAKIKTIANNDKLFSDITVKYDATKTPDFEVFENNFLSFSTNPKEPYIKITPDILVSNVDNKYVLSLSDESKDKLQIENPKTDLRFFLNKSRGFEIFQKYG